MHRGDGSWLGVLLGLADGVAEDRSPRGFLVSFAFGDADDADAFGAAACVASTSPSADVAAAASAAADVDGALFGWCRCFFFAGGVATRPRSAPASVADVDVADVSFLGAADSPPPTAKPTTHAATSTTSAAAAPPRNNQPLLTRNRMVRRA